MVAVDACKHEDYDIIIKTTEVRDIYIAHITVKCG